VRGRNVNELREDIAKRDERIHEMEQSQWRLQHLYAISKLLTPVQNFEQTIPAAVALVAQTVPLRSAIFIWEAPDAPKVVVWQAEGESAEQLRAAKDRAQTTYNYLARCRADLAYDESSTLDLPRLPVTGHATDATSTFVTLPFAVGHSPIFGALQVEGARALQEPDLGFIDAVVNQLAIALDRRSADRALRISEEKLARIVSSAADAIISVDETQRIVMYNAGAEKIFGWLHEEALGKPLALLLPARFRLIHHEHVSAFATVADAARKMTAHGGREILGLRKSGEEFPAEAVVSKLSIGGAPLFTVMLRDITEQKRIEHERVFLAEVSEVLATTLDTSETLSNIAHLALRALADFCIIEFLDEHGELRQLDVSTADPAKAGVAEALKQLPLDRSRPHLSMTIVRTRQPQLIAHVSPDTIAALVQSDEHRRLIEALAPTSIMGVPLIIRGDVAGAITVGSCRADRRYEAADLRLLEEVGRRAGFALENSRLYRITQHAVQARDDVLAIVAHDLRNPLHTIRMQAELLRQSEGERNGRSEPAEVIERAAVRMSRLVRDLLDVARIEAGRLSIERCGVPAEQVLHDSIAAQEPLALSANLELRLDGTPGVAQVWADRYRLLQVFANLIDNAIKSTPPAGQITVGARLKADEVLFWVADTGAGIAAEALPHVFERFWHGHKTGHRGAGLGLPIVKGIVEAHGGRIWVESALGRGSTFFFTVPVAPRAENRS
jgi:PAS domain S-box-containing protein